MERFENFASNKLVKDELNTAMNANSLPHAIIIEGDEGTGKKTLAKISLLGYNTYCCVNEAQFMHH